MVHDLRMIMAISAGVLHVVLCNPYASECQGQSCEQKTHGSAFVQVKHASRQHQGVDQEMRGSLKTGPRGRQVKVEEQKEKSASEDKEELGDQEMKGSLNSSAKRPNCGSEHFFGGSHRRRRWWSARRRSCDCSDRYCCEPDAPSQCPKDAPIYEEGAMMGEGHSAAYIPCSCECTAPEGYELFERTWKQLDDSCEEQDSNVNYYVKFNFGHPYYVRDLVNRRLSSTVYEVDACTCMCAKVHGTPTTYWQVPNADNGDNHTLCVGQCGGGCPGGSWMKTCMAHDVCVVASEMHGNDGSGGFDSYYCGGTRFAQEVSATVLC